MNKFEITRVNEAYLILWTTNLKLVPIKSLDIFLLFLLGMPIRKLAQLHIHLFSLTLGLGKKSET